MSAGRDAMPLVAHALTTRPGAPWLLDAFCGAGGAGYGYWLAGFNVVGVDIVPMVRYPFWFVQMDAIAAIEQFGRYFDAIHASPPCQQWSKSAQQWRSAGRTYPDLIAPVRAACHQLGKPYTIENVPGAPLHHPVYLNGPMFGLRIHRPRWFECSFDVPDVGLSFSMPPPVKMGRPVREGDVVQPVGHFSGVEYVQREMGCPWMNRDELAQAIPPAYTHFIGVQMMRVLANRREMSEAAR